MSKHYDISGLQKMAVGNDEFVKKMINMFVDLAPSQLDSMQHYLEMKNYEEFGKTAHSMKPSIDMICTEDLRKEVRTLENKGKGRTDVELLPVLFGQYRKKINLAITELKQDFS